MLYQFFTTYGEDIGVACLLGVPVFLLLETIFQYLDLLKEERKEKEEQINKKRMAAKKYAMEVYDGK